MLLAASVAAAQADIAALRSRTSFAAAEEGQIAEAIKGDIDKLIAGQSDDVVAAARDSLIKRAEDAAATAEYRAAVAKVTVLEIASRLNNAVVHRNRLSVAIVVARMQNVQSLEVLLKLLGEGKDGEFYPSVRYWAAKGLAGAPLIEAIRTGAGTAMPQRTVLTWLQEAVTRETSPVVAAELFAVLAAIQTEAATDILVPAVAAKARQFDLSQPTAAEAMKSAVALLQKAFELERREAAAGKQPIVASLVQIMVQTPPKDAGLELAETLDATLATLTGQKTALAAAIKEFRDQASTGLRPQQVDAIWLQQLNWMETLLKTANKDVRLLSRPQVLAWKSELSAGVVTAIQKGK
jgi:hypothetical protein